MNSPQDILLIERSGAILGEVLSLVAKKAVAGTALHELDKFAETEIQSRGGVPAFKGYRRYPCASCLSVNDAIVHGMPSNYMLKDGDVLGIDLGVNYQGWYTDAATTVLIGSVDKKTQELVAATKEALLKAIKVVKPGIKVGLISSTVEAVAKEYGLGIVKNLTGHGVGKTLHEPPTIPNYGNPNQGEVIEVGQALAIEPMFCSGSGEVTVGPDGWTVSCTDGIGSHHEATVLVTETGVKVIAGVI